MQAQAHVSGQVSGEAAGQLPGLAQQNGGSLPSQASNIVALRKLWHWIVFGIQNLATSSTAHTRVATSTI